MPMERTSFSDIFKGSPKVLAPLVGGSDLSFRLLCRKYGADVTFTEMCQAYYFNHKDRVKKSGSSFFEFDNSDRPLILQVAATVDEADEVIEMVNLDMFAGKIDAVDLNCGCPQGFAMKRGVGSGLFHKGDPFIELVRKIRYCVLFFGASSHFFPSSSNIPYPLSIKCRLHEDGVDETIKWLQKAVEAGASAITVHGRFWWQKVVLLICFCLV